MIDHAALHRRPFLLPAFYSRALLVLLLLAPARLDAQQPIVKEVYQDFRGKAPMPPQFRLDGPDLDEVTSSERAGFRITFPKERKSTRNVQIASTFDITGDFEITGSYELLKADQPTDGWGVGVALNVADTNDLHKFLKIGRFMRPKTGGVYMAEYWTKGADDWRGPMVPTDVLKGQLRVVRAGRSVRCQVAEGAAQEFATIFEKADFGAEDIAHMRFMVTNGNKAGYAVDARLVDLRIRYGGGSPEKAVAPPAPVEPDANPPAKGWLAAYLLLGLALTVILAMALGLFIYVRRRGASAEAALVAVRCSACGKSLKAKANLVGKKIKCGQCGKAVLVALGK